MFTITRLIIAALAIAAGTAMAGPGGPGAGPPMDAGVQLQGGDWHNGPGGGDKGDHARGPAGPMRRQVFEENLFEPELVMQNQRALGLNEEQTSAIRSEMRKQMVTFMDLQWQLEAEQEAFGALLKEDRIDEAKAMAQLDKMMATESKMKRLRMKVLVKVKNILTPDQQATLRKLFVERGPMRTQKAPPGGQQQELSGPRAPQIKLPNEKGVQAPQGPGFGPEMQQQLPAGGMQGQERGPGPGAAGMMQPVPGNLPAGQAAPPGPPPGE